MQNRDLRTDGELRSIKNLTDEVMQECQRQVRKWGVQKVSIFEWFCFLTEEVGELAEAISEHHYRGGDAEAIKKEAIQVATLALKIAEMYSDRIKEVARA